MRLIPVLILMFCLVIPVHAQDDVFRPAPPEHTEVITPENADRLEPLGILGRGVIRGMGWSPDSAILAVKTTIGVWIYAEGREEPFLIEGDIESVTFDQAWQTLAIKHGGQIDVWDIRQLEKRAVTVDFGDMALSQFPPILSADGSVLTFLVSRPFGADVQVWRWDVGENRLKDSLSIGGAYISDVKISPRRDALIVERGGGNISEVIRLEGVPERIPLYSGGVAIFHPTRPLAAVRESTDGAYRIRLFDYATGSDVATLDYPRYSTHLLFTPSGDRLLIYAVHSYAGDLWSWNFTTDELKVGTGGREISSYRSFHVSFTPDERYVIFEENNRYQRWNLETMRAEASKLGSQYDRFSEDGRLRAISNSEGISVFPIEGDTPIAQLAGEQSPVFSPDGEKLAGIRWGSREIAIHPLDGSTVSIESGGYGEYTAFGFAPTGFAPTGFAPTGFAPQGGLLIQRRTETRLWEPPFRESALLSSEWIQLDHITGTDDRMDVFSFERNHTTLRHRTINAVDGGFEVTEHEPRIFEIYTEPQDWVMHYTFSPDGRLFVASGGEDPYYEWGVPYLYLRDVETGHYEYLYDHNGLINSIAFSPDGRGFASGSGFTTEYYEGDDTTLRLWDIQIVNGTRKLVERARFYYDDPVYEVGYSPDSRLIAARMPNEVSVRNTVSGREVFHLEAWRAAGFAFSPDSRLLAVQIDGFLQLWSLESGEKVGQQPLAAAATIRFDPTGRWIVTTATDGVVRLWGVSEGSDS